jgi:hypothetical protein
MVGVTLTDGDVAALARQAVDLLDPGVDIAIEPGDRADPYRWAAGRSWVVWLLVDGHRVYDISLTAGRTPAEALGRLLDDMSNDVAETDRYWGQAFPACLPRHPHPADVVWSDPQDDDDGAMGPDSVTLRCPATGETVARLVPDVPG